MKLKMQIDTIRFELEQRCAIELDALDITVLDEKVQNRIRDIVTHQLRFMDDEGYEVSRIMPVPLVFEDAYGEHEITITKL